MASLLLRPILRPQLLAGPIGVGLGLYTYTQLVSNRSSLYKLDSGSILSGGSSALGNGAYSYSTKAKTPVVTKEGRMNPKAIRQVSLGSITGLCAGLLVSTFSKPLALILGLMVVGVQYASSHFGINVIPYNRLQKYVGGIDLRSAVQDNVALKMSFGLTFAMAGFMSF